MGRPLVEQLAQLAVGIHCHVARTIAADEMGIVDVCATRCRLPTASGFQVDSGGIGLCCRAVEPGARGSRIHFAERARVVKGQNPR
jgi:hypothetical protein